MASYTKWEICSYYVHPENPTDTLKEQLASITTTLEQVAKGREDQAFLAGSSTNLEDLWGNIWKIASQWAYNT